MHRKAQFTKYLQKLRRAGGRSAFSAERAVAIIATLSSAPGSSAPGSSAPGSSAPGLSERVNRLTKFGERRIEGCQKYDLGSGYRLVYVKEAVHYIFLFVGTHDDCDRWLTNNKYLQDLQLDRLEDDAWCVSEPTACDPAAPPPQAESQMDYDDILMQTIDEQTLRRVFHGLCGD
jgi:hypothetical protein